ncbi:MAG TPA: ABC transporter permease, partial [candidate division WOR-3 bacterium]|nr:ABC transporter permease [candidate division WOR-3 bacterium]
MVIKKLIEVITHIGEFFILMKDSVLGVTNLYKIRKELLRQLEFFGVNSIPLVTFASLFTGMVSSVQTAYQIRDYAPLDFLGAGVAKAVMVELGPVLTALIMAGRVGAGIAAELGTMRVTEQIDALEVIGIDPAGFLILPRLIAGLIMVPLLTVLADFVAITGSAVISKLIL